MDIFSSSIIYLTFPWCNPHFCSPSIPKLFGYGNRSTMDWQVQICIIFDKVFPWAYFYWGWFQTRFTTTTTLKIDYYVVNKPKMVTTVWHTTRMFLICRANLYRICNRSLQTTPERSIYLWSWKIIGGNLLPDGQQYIKSQKCVPN